RKQGFPYSFCNKINQPAYIHDSHLISSQHQVLVTIIGLLVALVKTNHSHWWGRDNNEEIPSTLATPNTPGAPLYGGFTNAPIGLTMETRTLFSRVVDVSLRPSFSCWPPLPPSLSTRRQTALRLS
ncbi:hypothetical protein VIGAN_07007600, partial [Vigna angularis var. angularis]